MGASYAAPPPGDDLASFEQQLALAEADLRRLGVTPRPVPTLSADVDDDVDDDAAADVAGDEVAGAQPAQDEAAPAAPEPAAEGEPERQEERGRRFSQREDKDRCTSICDVAQTVCTLEGKICELASAHGDDPRYENACARASDDCEVGEEACRACKT